MKVLKGAKCFGGARGWVFRKPSTEQAIWETGTKETVGMTVSKVLPHGKKPSFPHSKAAQSYDRSESGGGKTKRNKKKVDQSVQREKKIST